MLLLTNILLLILVFQLEFLQTKVTCKTRSFTYFHIQNIYSISTHLIMTLDIVTVPYILNSAFRIHLSTKRPSPCPANPPVTSSVVYALVFQGSVSHAIVSLMSGVNKRNKMKGSSKLFVCAFFLCEKQLYGSALTQTLHSFLPLLIIDLPVFGLLPDCL